MARKDDVEMQRGRRNKPAEDLDDTEYRPINWKRFFFAPKYIPWHLLAIALIVITVLITVKHDQVVEKLRPWSEQVRDLPAGWLIPIAILFVISFPPLFGHEIVALLCGVVWGLWIGFGIVAAGTFFGEIGTWYAFKYAFRRKAQKLERTNLNYGSLARITREGGFWIVLVIRFSAIPTHFSTAVFSTCDVKFWHFAVATFLTLPKQLILVYFGVLLVQKQDDSLIKTIIVAVAFAITVALGGYIWWKMRRIRNILLEEQAERRRNREMNMLQKTDSATAGSGSMGGQTTTGSTVSLVRRAESPGVSEGVMGGSYQGASSGAGAYQSYRPDPSLGSGAYGAESHRPTRPRRSDEDAIEPYYGADYAGETFQSGPYRSQRTQSRREPPASGPFEPMRKESSRPWA